MCRPDPQAPHFSWDRAPRAVKGIEAQFGRPVLVHYSPNPGTAVDPNILCQNLKSLGVNEMSEPRFSVGQKVRYSPSVTQDRQSGAGFFEIISMPDERVGHSYRIRHVSISRVSIN